MHIVNYVLALVCLTSAASASPLEKRQKSSLAPNDTMLLNYALVLEHLEAVFYRQGLANFTQQDFEKANFSSAVYSEMQLIATQEAAHVSYLTKAINALNASAIPECTYHFNVTDVKDFVNTASVIEGVGVSAYLGAVSFLKSKSYLTQLSTILSVESRHSAWLRYNALNQQPFPLAFDTALDFDAVHSLVKQFIVCCPATDSPFPPITGIQSFPQLEYTSATHPIKVNDTIELTTPTLALVPDNSNTYLYAAFASRTTANNVVTCAVNGSRQHWTVQIPVGAAGQTYVFLTSCNDTLTDDTILAGPAILEIGD